MTQENKGLSGRRVYVTFLADGTVVIHPSDCTGTRFAKLNSEAEHLSKKDALSADVAWTAVLKARNRCKTV